MSATITPSTYGARVSAAYEQFLAAGGEGNYRPPWRTPEEIAARHNILVMLQRKARDSADGLSKADLRSMLPELSVSALDRTLTTLANKGAIRRTGVTRKTRYHLVTAPVEEPHQ